MAEERHTAAFVVGMLVGGLAGAAFVLWKTPRSGADLRAQLTESAESLLENVRHLGERLGIESGAPDAPAPMTPTPAPSDTFLANSPTPETAPHHPSPITKRLTPNA